jgi:hypothetical protein
VNQPAKTPESDTRRPYPDDTVFLVPEIPYDILVIRGYLTNKYKNVPKDMVVSQVNMNYLPHAEKCQFIVCVRRGKDGSVAGPEHTIVPDERGILRTKPIAPETYHHEVVESPPVRVRDHIQMGRATMFQQVEPNLNPLINVLCDHAWPFRVTPQNKPDVMLRCVI